MSGTSGGVEVSPSRPFALVDYLVIFAKEDQSEQRLCKRYPDEDIVGAALPLTELLPHVADAQNLDPAVSFTVSDAHGNLFYCTRVVFRPEAHRDFEYVLIVVSRKCRFKLFQDALIGLKTLLLSGDCVDAQLEQMFLEMPLSAEDRVVKCVWEGVGELNIHPSMMKGGLPEVEDYSMNLLLDSMPPETLLAVIEALLKEENILVVSSKPGVLAPAIEALKALLYPFVWCGLCVHLIPRDSVARALTRRGLPWFYGLVQSSMSSVKDLMHRLHHQDTPRCLIVSLDEGRWEWLGPPPVQTSPGLWVEFRRSVVEKYRLQGPERIDGVRLGILQGYLDMLHRYKPHVNSWSTSSQSKREAGFDCEAFLSQSKLEFFDLLKYLLSTRMFADFVFRVVNFSTHMSGTFDKLCKAWPQPELPHAARELLMRRYGYTERGARAVWARVKHLQGDPNLFSTKKFRDFVSELGLSKEGPPSTGDPIQDEIADRQLRIQAIAERPSEASLGPPLLLSIIARRPKEAGDSFPPPTLCSNAFNQRLAPWIPRRDDSVLFLRPSARATYFAFCGQPSDDELLAWKSLNLTRPRLHLAFIGGSSELKSALASASSSTSQSASGVRDLAATTTFPKPVVSLTCAMKWAQLQGKRSLYDANQMLFQLLMEERHRHRDDMRRLREKRSSSSMSGTSLQGMQSHQQQQQQYAGESSSMNEVEALELRVRELEEKLRQSEAAAELLTKQMRESAFPGTVVRKAEPLFSPRDGSRALSPLLVSPKMMERPSSPTASFGAPSPQAGSGFTSPMASTPRKMPSAPTPMEGSGSSPAMRHSSSGADLSQAPPYSTAMSHHAANMHALRASSPHATHTRPGQGSRMASPPPTGSSKSFFGGQGNQTGGATGPDALKRSVSFNDIAGTTRPVMSPNAQMPPATGYESRPLTVVSPMSATDHRMVSPDFSRSGLPSPDSAYRGTSMSGSDGPGVAQAGPRMFQDGLPSPDRRGSVSSELMSNDGNMNSWSGSVAITGAPMDNLRMGSPPLMMNRASSPPPVGARKPANVMTPSAIHPPAGIQRQPSPTYEQQGPFHHAMPLAQPHGSSNQPVSADTVRRERNQRVLDTIESGYLRRMDSSQDSSEV